MTNNLPAALVRCSSYEPDTVAEAIDRALSLLGGLDKYIKPGMRVFLKANLMRKSAPELCAVTHPAVVYAVAKRIAALGATVTVGDSPGGIFNQNILKGVYHTCGYTVLEEIDGVTLNYDCREVTVEAKDALKLKSFPMLAAIAEADVVVNVAKLKSHTLTVYSGAVKNLYGVIPGLKKAEYHFTFQDIDDFSDMLLDIAEHVSPTLHIIDGVFAMEVYNRDAILCGVIEGGMPLYTEALRHGKPWCCIASDDAHGIPGTAYPAQGFVMISADELKYDKIMAALEAGDFYASSGPVIEELYIEDGVIHLKCSPVKFIGVDTNGRPRGGAKKVNQPDEYLTEVEIKIKEGTEYVRFDLQDEHGNWAHTRAYYVDGRHEPACINLYDENYLV